MRRFLITLAAVWGFYLVSANWLVNSTFLRNQINTWNDGYVSFRWVITPFPGFVWARDFYLAHEDRNVRWNTRFKSVRAFVSPLHLLFSELRASFIHVSDGRFYFLEKKNLSNREIHFLLPQVWVPHGREENPKPSNAKPFGVYLSDVSVKRLREAWVNAYRTVGDLNIHAHLRIRPDHSVEVGPATLRMGKNDLYIGDRKIGSDLEGKFHYEMGPFHPDANDDAIIRSMKIDGGLSFHAHAIEPLNILLAEAPWVQFAEADGRVGVQLKVAEGKFLPGTSANLSHAPLRIRVGPLEVKGTAAVKSEVTDQQLILNTELDDIQMSQAGAQPFLEGGRFTLAATTQGLSLVKNTFAPIRLKLAVVKGIAPEVKRLNPLLATKDRVVFEKGKAVVDVTVESDSAHPFYDHGEVNLISDNLRLKAYAVHFEGKLTAKLPFEESRFPEGAMLLRNGSLVFNDEKYNPPWRLAFHVPRARVNVKDNTSVRGRVEVEMNHTLPVVKMARSMGLNAIVGSLLKVEDLNGTARMVFSDGNLAINQIKILSSGLDVYGQYRLSEGEKWGNLLAVKEPFAVGIRLRPNGDSVVLQDAFSWYHRMAE